MAINKENSYSGQYYHSITILVFILLFIRGLVFVFLIPLWLGPDEPTHVEYVMRLSRQTKFDKNMESDKRIRERMLFSMKESNYEGFGSRIMGGGDISPVAGASTPPFYYFFNAALIKLLKIDSFENQIYFMRLISMMLGIGNLILIYLTANKICFEESGLFSIAVVSFAGFLPQYSYMTATVNPENLVNLIITSIVFFCVLAFSNGLRWHYILSILILLFLGHITKTTIFIVLPLPIIVLAYKYGRKLLNYKKNLSKRAKIIAFIALSGIMGFVCEELLSRGLIQKIYLQSVEILQLPYNLIKLGFSSPFLYIKEIAVLFVSFWLSYGHMVYKMSIGWYILLFVISVFSLTGCILTGKDIFQKKYGWHNTVNTINIKGAVLLIALIVINIAAIYFDEFKACFKSGIDPSSMSLRTQGRYLFSSLSAISCLFVLGIRGISPVSNKADAMKFLIVFMIFLNMVSIFKYLIPIFYL